MRVMNIFCGLLLTTLASAGPASPDTARSIMDVEQQPFVEGCHFAIAGRVVLHNQADIVVEDETGLVFLNRNGGFSVKAGDRIQAAGDFTTNVIGRVYPLLTEVRVLSRGDLPRPAPVTAEQYRSGAADLRFVQIEGFVRDIFKDEIDLNWTDVILQCGRETILVAFISKGSGNDRIKDIIGKYGRFRGVTRFFPSRDLRPARRVLITTGIDAFEPLEPLSPDPFDVPEVSDLTRTTVEDIQRQNRHRTTGRVIAVWHDRHLLLRDAKGHTTEATLSETPVPAYGANVEISGFPTTDSYKINLEHAVWRPSRRSFPPEEAATDISPSILLVNELGSPGVNARYHGQTVRLTGTVIDLSEPDRLITLAWGTARMVVNASHVPAPFASASIGCRVRVSGICRMSMGGRRIGNTASHDRIVSIILRSPSDLEILQRPPWWTPGRLLALLGIFATALFGTIVWNVSLNRRAIAKGEELAAEQLAHVTSELKVSERTRLAVELHDALSQTLTGVSMQIDTAAGLVKGRMPTATRCLALASRTIDACRMELRNTLWDLRSEALDEPNMDAAIRKTLCQNLSGIDLSVRFNVPRETFTDNTAHAVLKITRELATNALRHGGATALWIAGTVDNGRLLFSVRDNGCGFDPDLAPGVGEGHFGLQGITERLERLNGEMKIESTMGKGTKVTVTLPIPSSGE